MESTGSLRRGSLYRYKKTFIKIQLMGNPLLLLPALFIIGAFIYLLQTSMYMYYFYIMAGILAFLSAQKIGRHLYLYLVLIRMSVSSYLNKPIYNLHYFNNDGLNIMGLHPFTIILITAAVLELAILIHNKKLKIDLLFLFGFLTIALFSIVTYLKRGFNGFPVICSNYLGPILLLLLFHNIRDTMQKEKIQKVLRVFLISAFFIGIFGLAEYILKWNPFFSIYKLQGWGYQQFTGQYRIMTILGHPLDNASYFLTATAAVNLCITDRRLKYGLLLLFSAVILATGSRSMFAVAVLIILFSNNIGIRVVFKELMLRIVSVAIVVALFFTPLGSTIIKRMNNVEGEQSAQARILAAEYFLKNYRSINIRGIGASSETVILVDSKHRPIILENPWVILFIEVSYLILFYIIFLFLVLRRTSSRWSIYMLILALSSANSFGVKGETNFELFLIIIANMVFTWLEKKKKAEVAAEVSSKVAADVVAIMSADVASEVANGR